MHDRRLRVLLFALLVIGTPAAALRFACVGSACPPPEVPPAPVPFCGLPLAHRELVEAGFREGRSPDVLVSVGSGTLAAPMPGGEAVPWPSVRGDPTRVPVVFLGPAVRRGPLPDGIGLDALAPTMASMLGFDRPFPDVRSGTRIAGVTASEDAPLGAFIVWSGVGTRDLQGSPASWPWLREAVREGAGSMRATTGSLPVDPAAGLVTIGTGAVPSLHGVTGSFVRADDGRVVSSSGPAAPLPVLATLAEDLDEGYRQASLIGLIGLDTADRGLIGGRWYLGADRDTAILGTNPVSSFRHLLAHGYGSRAPADLIGVVLHGSIAAMDQRTARITALLRREVPRAAIAITATGSLAGSHPAGDAREVADLVDGSVGTPIVEAIGAGGLFLDLAASTAAGVGADHIAGLVRTEPRPSGAPVIADAYPSFSVTLARYC